MSGGSILAIIGGILALLGPILLPFITVDESEEVLRAFSVSTGIVSVLMAAAIIALSVYIYKKRHNDFGAVVATLSLAMYAVMGVTYANVWSLTGLVEETLVTLDWGYVLTGFGATLSLFGGLIAWGSYAEYDETDRFLRVTLVWDGTIVAEHVAYKAAPITIGDAAGVTFQLPAADSASHELFTPAGEHAFKINIPKGIDAHLSIGGEEKNEKTGDGAVIGVKDWGFLHFDNDVQLVFSFMEPIAHAPSEGGLVVDTPLATSFSTVGALAFVLLISALLTAKDKRREGMQESLEKKQQEVIALTLEDKPPEEKEPEPVGDEDDTTGKKAGGEEGKFGDPDIDPKKESKVPKMDGRMVDKIDVKNIGINKVLGGKQALTGALGSIMAGDTGALSSKMAVAMSGSGSELVIGHGSGGMGFRGTGSGGGGTGGYGRIHGLGAIDTGGGTGSRANIGLGKKAAKKVSKFAVGAGSSTGGCDKSNISQVVRSRATGIRACYETQLLSKPDLAGKVTARWTIDSEGGVGDASLQNSSLGNPSVEDCVLRTIRRMRFAKPDAGVCVVQWPFVFSPGG